MKFGYLTISYKHWLQFPMSYDHLCVGLGDFVQGLGAVELYRKMGIPQKDIIPIDFEDLAVYNGEDVILPINFHMVEGCASSFPPSPHILPVFLGLHNANHTMPHGIFDYEDYYKLFEPIGCRDQDTCDELVRRGIDAYVFGCMSFFFPKRKQIEPDCGKVFIVDASPEFEAALPPTIRENAIRLTHAYHGRDRSLTETDIAWYNEELRLKLLQYANEARLVITKRLHVAAPCIAMGIPVICCASTTDRYGWLKHIIPLFGPDTISKIDWDSPPPPLVDVESLKSQMMSRAEEAIKAAIERYKSGEFHTLRLQILESTLIGLALVA